MSNNSDEVRPASASDVEQGRAVFYVSDSRSRVHSLGFALPAEATTINDMDLGDGESIPAGTPITVIQVEIVDERDVLLGFTYLSGRGVCNADQVTFK